MVTRFLHRVWNLRWWAVVDLNYSIDHFRIEPILFEFVSCYFDKVCQSLATGRWLSPGTPVSSTNKTDCHDITEILSGAKHHNPNPHNPLIIFLFEFALYVSTDVFPNLYVYCSLIHATPFLPLWVRLLIFYYYIFIAFYVSIDVYIRIHQCMCIAHWFPPICIVYINTAMKARLHIYIPSI